MSKEFFTNQIVSMYRAGVKPPAVNKAEREGRIPTANRKKRGKVEARYWTHDDLPELGKVFGSLKAPEEPWVCAAYVPKGGVGKTTWVVNLARILGIHGMKGLVIGADFQCNLSKAFGVDYDEDTLPYSLYDCMADGKPLKEIIVSTEIPTLDLVPESPELALLDRVIATQFKRESLLSKAISKVKSNYDFIIIDCPPQWNEVVTNALMAADAIVSPIAADSESYHSFKMFVPALTDFINKSEKSFDMIKFIVNNVDVRTKYTTSYQKKYLDDYPELFLSTFLRETVTIKEAMATNQSVLEYDPKSSASEDVYNAIYEIWSEVTSEVH